MSLEDVYWSNHSLKECLLNVYCMPDIEYVTVNK